VNNRKYFTYYGSVTLNPGKKVQGKKVQFYFVVIKPTVIEVKEYGKMMCIGR